jgi:hypothetical protein
MLSRAMEIETRLLMQLLGVFEQTCAQSNWDIESRVLG